MVGEVICRANFVEGGEHFWTVRDEGEFCTININFKVHCVAVVFLVSNLVVGIEIDDDCAAKIIEPLMKRYGFDNVKWLLMKSHRNAG